MDERIKSFLDTYAPASVACTRGDMHGDLDRMITDAREQGRQEGRHEAAILAKMWGDVHGVGKSIYTVLMGESRGLVYDGGRKVW